MNDALKNPLVLFVAALLGLWLAYKILKFTISIFGLLIIVFVVLFIVNPRFRATIQALFSRLF